MVEQLRTFTTGATRDGDRVKVDYEGFLSPLVLARFGRYMHKHRRLKDGTMRDSDNWQRGIPRDVYLKSACRHFMEWWTAHRGWKRCTAREIEDILCAVIFNAQGYLHEHLVVRQNSLGKARVKYPLHGGGLLKERPAYGLKDVFRYPRAKRGKK